MSNMFSRTDKTIWGRWWWTIDRRMLAALISLMVIGVLLVAAASPPVAVRIGLPQFYFITHHIMVLVPSFLIMIAISLCDLRTLWRVSSVILAGGILMMIGVLASGMEIKGAQRWLQLPGCRCSPASL